MSGTRTFLLELHCEEIPARFLKPLSHDFGAAIWTWSDEVGVAIEDDGAANYCTTYTTDFYSPRKLAWRVSRLLGQQPDQSETQIGPPQRMCVGEDGKPTIQGLKFAEKWGVDFSTVRFEQPAGKKEPCAVVTVAKKGRPTKELLAEAMPGLIAGLHVPKAMRWGSSEFAFVRPIRSILCLFGEEVVDFTVDGVTSGTTTWGHRLYHRQHPEPLVVKRPEDYEKVLEDAGIVVSFAQRKAAMAQQLEALAKDVQGRVVADDHLLATLAEIVEVPKIIRGDFPGDFLELPKEVLVTSLAEHQKAFCIEDAEGRLLPHFLTAANRADDPKGFVKSGNEWVLKARLYDARFFFAEDRKHTLETRLDALKQLTFQRELGSYYDKTERVMKLAERLAGLLNLNTEHAKEAARLAKCDLRTLMVGEFPELQGVMGGEYLLREGKPEPVWKAVKEHYHPIGAEDNLPSEDNPLGALLSLADKLDTVAGCFSVGLVPSGSKDPLALRRAGQGIVRILWEREWNFTIPYFVKTALEGFTTTKTVDSNAQEALNLFFLDRVTHQLEQLGYAGAIRRSALAVDWENLRDLKARCAALSAFADDPRFASLAQSSKRIANILKDENPSKTFDAALLVQIEEKVLAKQLDAVESQIQAIASERDAGVILAEGSLFEFPYVRVLTLLAELADPLAAFFDAVMVKDKDQALKDARLSLLHRLRQAFLRVADFSQWQ